MKKSSGFIQIIALIIVFVVVALYFGKSPLGIWNETLKPLILSSLKLMGQAVEFLISFITEAWQRSRG